MGLEKLPEESNLDYHKRIVYGKLVDKTLSDYDYTELAEAVYNQSYSPDVARRMMYGSCRTLQLIDSEHIEAVTGENAVEDIDSKIIELKKERQKLTDQRVAFNKIVREVSRREELNEIIKDAVFNGNLPTLGRDSELRDIYSGAEGDNDLLVSLNDIHYGANVDNYWAQYNSDICVDMFNKYLDNIIKIAKTHNSENCYVWCNGDAISGNIHYSIAVTNKENVIEQIKGVSEIIAQFLAELSKHFNNVTFISVSGNHSRINPDKDKCLMEECLDDLIPWYVEARLAEFHNIHIITNNLHESMYTIDVRGKTYLGVHGNYDGSKASVQSLQQMAGKPVYAILSGHLHHGRTETVQGVKTVMSGSFLGMDDNCIKNRIVSTPEQTVCVCDENGIRCFYEIEL